MKKFALLYITGFPAVSAQLYPGSRYGGVLFSSSDSSDILFLFGGYGYASTSSQGYLNDLWALNLTTRNYAFIGGSTTINSGGTYGTIRVPSASNQPSARRFFASTTLTSKLYLFGGENSVFAYLNDLWRYDMLLNQWTWISGSLVGNQLGLFGTKGVYNTAFIPGGRNGAGLSVDVTQTELIIFGGKGYATSNVYHLNDL